MVRRVAMTLTALGVALGGATMASAQATGSPQAPAQQPGTQQSGTASPPANGETRPATTTFMGDTGLWFVPTGEVLPARRWSVSAYRVNFDFNQGFTDVTNFPVTFGVGLADRA